MSILKKNFTDTFQAIDKQHEHGLISAEEIAAYILKHPDMHALSSHHFRYPRPVDHADVRFVDICFLRHPLDRLQSMYFYYRSIPDGSDKSRTAKSMTLPDFLRWMLEVEPQNTMDPQTSFMATGGKYFFPPSSFELETAVRRVADVRFLGVVDRFDESLIIARFFFKSLFPTLDFTYSPENVSRNVQMTLTEKLEHMKDLCGGDLFDRLRRVNENDEKLWRYATEELSRRLQYVPNGQRHLDEGVVNLPKGKHS